MKNYITAFFGIGCFLLCSCEPEVPTCAITLKELLDTEFRNVFPVDPRNPTSDYRDKGIDSIVGGYYSFYPNGKLKEYDFFVSRDTVIYKEQFDSLGYLRYQEGNPLIHKSAKLIADSLVLTFYFFTLEKRYESIDIYLENGNHASLVLNKNSLFSNVQAARYVINGLSKEQDIDGYINIQYKNECTGDMKKMTDSINLHYSPN